MGIHARGICRTQQGSKLTTSAVSEFGDHVALSGDGSTALVSGVVFLRSDGTWARQGAVLSTPGVGGLSEDGSVALIDGKVFARTGPTWTQQGSPLSIAGQSDALSGDGQTALIGNPADNHGIGIEYNFGSAWVYSTSEPSVSIAVPANGAQYTLGQVLKAGYSCQEGAGGPGISSCTGSVPSGARIDTTTVGPHTFTVTASSEDGRHTTQSVTYTVVFPTQNGLLVAEPLNGRGQALIDPHNGVSMLACADPTVCGRPVQPRWSPNGLAIAFTDSASLRVGILAPDGSCLWCMLGAPLSRLHGSHAAFTADGRAVTFIGGKTRSSRSLWEVGLGARSARLLLQGSFTDAVWSAQGRLAVVRAGSIWVGGTGRHTLQLRQLSAGAAPAWSPNGAWIALTRNGRVELVRVRDGSARRLVRGSAPAWSPDGSRIAYVGAGHFLNVVAAAGGRAQRVTTLRVRSVAWRPRPLRGACAPAKGTTIVASSAQAVITRSSASTSWYGCLPAVGPRGCSTQSAGRTRAPDW